MNRYLVAWKRELRLPEWTLDTVGSTVLDLPAGVIDLNAVTEMVHDKEGDDRDHIPTRYSVLALTLLEVSV